MCDFSTRQGPWDSQYLQVIDNCSRGSLIGIGFGICDGALVTRCIRLRSFHLAHPFVLLLSAHL